MTSRSRALPSALTGLLMLVAVHAVFAGAANVVDWTGGSVPGSAKQVGKDDTLKISGKDHDLDTSVTNEGTVEWNDGKLKAGNGGNFTNNGTFIDSTDSTSGTGVGTVTQDPESEQTTLVNTGTYKKTGNGQTTLEIGLDNSGTLELQAGTLSLKSGGALRDGSTQTGNGQLRLENGTLEATGTSTFSNFQITGGSVQGSHTLNGNVEWAGGDFSSVSSTTTIGGSLRITNNTDHAFSGRSFQNNGSVEWSGGTLTSGNGGSFTNNGTFNDATAGGILATDGTGAAPQFTNASGATFNKNGNGTTKFEQTFTNDGTVNALAGSLELAAGGSASSGSDIQVSSGASVRFSGGNFNIANGASLRGNGHVQIAGGTVDLSGTVSEPSLALSGGLLTGTHTLNGSGAWTGGALGGSGTTTIGTAGTLQINGTGDLDFGGRALVNNGTVNWAGGRLRTGNAGSLANNSLLVDSTSAGTVNATELGGSASFQNNAGGTYRRTGTGQTNFEIGFHNSGTIDVQDGTVSLKAGGALNHGTSQTGGGRFQLDSGTLSATGTSTFSNFRIAGGSVTGDHTLRGQLEWTGGGFTGESTTTLDGTVKFNGAGNLSFDRHSLVNDGTVEWTGGALRGNGASIRNNGTFTDSTTGGTIDHALGGGGASFANHGAFVKSAAGTTTVSVPFANHGAVNVSNGTLRFSGGYTHGGGTLGLGNGAILRFDQGLNLAGGSLIGKGRVIGDIDAFGLISASAHSPNAHAIPGLLHIEGNLRLNPAAGLLFEIGGDDQGTTYDFVSLTGSASLGQSLLSVGFTNGFTADAAQTFTVLTAAGGFSGEFSNALNGEYFLMADGSGRFRANYGSTSLYDVNALVLSEFTPIPEPSTWILIGVGGLSLLAARRRRKQ